MPGTIVRIWVEIQNSIGVSLVAQLVKNPPAMQETRVRSLGWKDPLEKGTATPVQYSGLENSMDCIVSVLFSILFSLYSPWGHKESTEHLSLSLHKVLSPAPNTVQAQ